MERYIHLSPSNPCLADNDHQNESPRINARARTNPPGRGQLASKPRSTPILHRPPLLRYGHEPRPLQHTKQHHTTLPISFSHPDFFSPASSTTHHEMPHPGCRFSNSPTPYQHQHQRLNSNQQPSSQGQEQQKRRNGW